MSSTPSQANTVRKQVFIDSSPLLGDYPALRARAEAEGYLFFRQLIPVDAVRAVRADLLRVVDEFGWRQPGQDLLGGKIAIDEINRVPDPDMRTDIGVSIDCYQRAQCLESVHRLPHHPHLLELYRGLFDREVLVHPRHIVRMITSHRTMVPTPPHQDFPLIQGTPDTWTAWIPMGDCPRTLGGLTVLRASHQNGYVPIATARGAGSIAAQLCPHETDWVEGDYQAGDVLTFPSYTIHKALRCQQKEEIRLSLDVRFQSADAVVEEKSLQPHCELTWDEIYADWTRDDLKYYWKKVSPSLSPWDDRFLQPTKRIC